MNPLVSVLLGKTFDAVAGFLDPSKKTEAQLALLKLQQDGLFKEIDTALAYSKQQADINLEDAKSGNAWQGGWRPLLGWLGGIGLGFQWVIYPLGAFVYTLATGHPLPAKPPELDPNVLWLLGSMLGINITARTFEKVRGAA